MDKKLRFISLLFALAITNLLCAQPNAWFEPGSTWTYRSGHWAGPEAFSTTVQISAATFLNRPCVVMEKSGPYAFMCATFDPPIYFYESNDSVFFALETDTAFRLAYNFNAQIGETWQYRIPAVEPDNFESYILNVKVKAIDYVWVEDVPLKQMTLKYNIQSNYNYELNPQEIRVLKYIGALDEFFIPQGRSSYCDAETNKRLQCFSSESFDYQNPAVPPCYVGINDEKQVIENLQIYPNPISDHFNLKTALTTQAELHIFQIDGRLIYNATLPAGTNRISVPSLHSGFYIIEIKENKAVLTAKVVVNR